MYVDKDSMDLVSVMEINSSDAYVITEALMRYATNPDIPADKRNRAKAMAIQIDSSRQKGKTSNKERS